MSRKVVNEPTGNVCIRCGQTRILKTSWEEQLTTGQGSTTLSHSQFVCPDENCQKQVEQGLAEKKSLAVERLAAQEKRTIERNLARTKLSLE